jgi:hypothetical protein
MRPRREGSVLDTAPDEAPPAAAGGRGRSTGETGWPPRAAVGTVRALAALLALVLLAIGILVDGAALGQWATQNLAPDGHLSPGTLAQIAGLRWLILLGGVLCALVAIAAPVAIRLYLALERLVLGLVGQVWRGLLLPLGRAIGRTVAALPRTVPAPRAAPLAMAALLTLVVAVAIYARTAQPPFHAEGLNLQPPRNLLEHGKYALHSYQNWDRDTYRITTGPAMLVPTALAYAIFGVNIWVAHAVAILFFLGFLILAYLSFSPHLGRGATVLGLTLFCLTPSNIFFGPSNGYVNGGMGEAPGLFYLVAGAMLWSSALARRSHVLLVVAGIAWGLSFQSKWLFLLALPALLGTWVVLALTGRRYPARTYLLPALGFLIPPLAFFLMRLSQFGLAAELAHLGRLLGKHIGRAAGFDTDEGQVASIFAVARPLITLAQVDFWRTLAAFVTLPALIYSGRKVATRLHPFPLFFLVFSVLWLTWWVLFSFDLPVQHILYVMPFVLLFTGKLIVDAWSAIGAALAGTRDGGRRDLLRALRLALVIAVAGLTAVPLASQIDDIHAARQTLMPAYREMLTYIETKTEPNALYAGWGWSKPWWLAIHHDVDIKDRTKQPYAYREPGRTEYLVVTPELPLGLQPPGWPNMSYPNRYTVREDGRRAEFIARHCTHLLTTGRGHQWHLYRVNAVEDSVPVSAPAVASGL